MGCKKKMENNSNTHIQVISRNNSRDKSLLLGNLYTVTCSDFVSLPNDLIVVVFCEIILLHATAVLW